MHCTFLFAELKTLKYRKTTISSTLLIIYRFQGYLCESSIAIFALTNTLKIFCNRRLIIITWNSPLKRNYFLYTWHLLRSEGLGSKYPVNSWELVRAQQVNGTFSRAFQPSFSSRDKMLSRDGIPSSEGIPSLDQVDKV